MATRRTPTDGATDPKPDADTRCPAVEGGQQCVSARHGKHQNHRWGPRQSTEQWNADGTPKGWFDVPESPTDVLAMQTPSRPETLPAVDYYALEYFHEDGLEHRHEGVTDMHAGGDRPHVHDSDIVVWRDGKTAEGATLVTGNADVLPAVPPGGVQAADPAQPTPDVATTSEPSGETAPSPAGSGGGSGRSLSLVRPDASEAVLAAAGGVLNPAAEPGHAITHAEEFARLLVVGMHFGRMLQANADKQLVGADDVRAVYRKMRQIAATHAIDLTDEGAGS